MNQSIQPHYLESEGLSLYHQKLYAESASTLHAARIGYETAGDWEKAAEMANNCSVALLQSGCSLDALKEIEGIEELYASAGDCKGQGITAGNLAAALESQKRYDEALDAYQRSADLLEKSGEDQLRATVLKSLSALQLKTGRKIEALVSLGQGIDGLKKPSFFQKIIRILLQYPFRIVN